MHITPLHCLISLVLTAQLFVSLPGISQLVFKAAGMTVIDTMPRHAAFSEQTKLMGTIQNRQILELMDLGVSLETIIEWRVSHIEVRQQPQHV